MKHLLICLSLAFALVSGASGQYVSDEQAKRADEIAKKVRQIDLLNQMLPLALTKDQLNKLLPSIEKARQAVKDQEKAEYNLLLKYEGRVDAAISAGIDKGQPPSMELLHDLNLMFMAMGIGRDKVSSDNANAVLAVMKEVLNKGQMKVAANSLNPKLFDPLVKVDEMTEDQKILFFCRNILLDPQAYDVMRQLLKKAG